MDDRDIGSALSYIYTRVAGEWYDDLDKDGIQLQGLQIVRFKGDSGDREQWIREYNSKYKGDGK